MAIDNLVLDKQINATIQKFGLSIFSTKDFIDRFSKNHPSDWASIVRLYGHGGKASGRFFTSNSFLSQQLKKKSLRGTLKTLHYERAPKGWGNRLIRFWTADLAYSSGSDYPDEAGTTVFTEGAKQTVTVNRYERDKSARKACLEHYGPSCAVCDRDFKSMYGKLGEGFIHVHHITPMSLREKEYEIDPIVDLIPVCPNCHAMLHHREKMLSVKELKLLWRKNNH